MSGLRVYRSNHVELLAELLAKLIVANPPSDPFVPIEVVVGSRGMERWLRHLLAERIGVCANMEFPFPTLKLDAMVAQIIALDADTDAVAAPVDRWAPDALAWALLEVLPHVVERPGFESVRAYVESWTGPVSAKAYAFARQLADVFDRYIIYRAELARAWSAGKSMSLSARSETADIESLGWQWALWQEIRSHLGGAPHRADRIAHAERVLRSGDKIAGIGGPLRLFGISSLPPLWMPLLGALSKHIDVELFLLCPSNEYWADLIKPRVRRNRSAWRLRNRDTVADGLRDPERGDVHPLLVSMGRVPRDFQIVLEAQDDDYEDTRVDLFVDGKTAFPDPAAEGSCRALHRLQSGLLDARPPGPMEEAAALEPSDDSVQFHHCYGATRQVEVLRDVLLGLFEDYPDLEPRDVVVMTPDIERYAPLVTSVFSEGPSGRLKKNGETIVGGDGWGPVGAPQIRFEVADLSIRRLNPVADAMLRVLGLVHGRFEASLVLDLLMLEPVRERFNLSAEELLKIRSWVSASGIRWARDAAHRAEAEQPADPQNTWRFGLRRLALGVVLAEDGRTLAGVDVCGEPATVRPFDDMEGFDTAVLGKLVDFMNTLFAVTDCLHDPRPLAQWIDALEAIVEQLTTTSASASWLKQRVREGIQQLAATATAALSKRAVSLEAVRHALEGQFEVVSRITKEQSGAVVFCAMQPMRSVPYRVVCLLGMDDGALPRKRSGYAFDLTAQAPRVGDRSLGDEDRYLLLEALLSARSHLVVLHTGHDPHTNDERPACVPIGELRDLIDQSFACPDGASSPSAWMTTHHPLQPFSERAFLPQHRDPKRTGSARPWSFDRRLLAGAEAVRQRQPCSSKGAPSNQATPTFFSLADDAAQIPRSDEILRADEIPLSELIRFFKGPTAYLMQRRLKVNLHDSLDLLQDREPIELDTLERWRLRQSLLAERLAGRGAPVTRQRLRAEGVLPLGFAGEATVTDQARLIEQMVYEAKICPTGADLPADPEAPLAIDIQLKSGRITGTLANIYGQYLVDLQFGAEEGTKNVAPIWLSLLAWHACRPDAGRAIMVLGTLAKGVPAPKLLGYQAPEDPRACLERLVAIYRRGCCYPIKLFPGASWIFAWRTRTLRIVPDLFAVDLPSDEAELKVIAAAHDEAMKVWLSGNKSRADLDDPHIERVFEGSQPVSDGRVRPVPLDLAFARLALQVWGPVLAGRVTSAAVKKDWIAGGLR